MAQVDTYNEYEASAPQPRTVEQILADLAKQEAQRENEPGFIEKISNKVKSVETKVKKTKSVVDSAKKVKDGLTNVLGAGLDAAGKSTLSEKISTFTDGLSDKEVKSASFGLGKFLLGGLAVVGGAYAVNKTKDNLMPGKEALERVKMVEDEYKDSTGKDAKLLKYTEEQYRALDRDGKNTAIAMGLVDPDNPAYIEDIAAQELAGQEVIVKIKEFEEVNKDLVVGEDGLIGEDNEGVGFGNEMSNVVDITDRLTDEQKKQGVETIYNDYSNISTPAEEIDDDPIDDFDASKVSITGNNGSSGTNRGDLAQSVLGTQQGGDGAGMSYENN